MRRLSFEIEAVGGDEEGFCLSRVPSEIPLRPRRSFHRSASSLTSALSFVSSRKSFSYDKLTQVPIQLSVIKLDGSSFEIDVTKSATIADLKQAVENVFNHLPIEGPDKISWRHVWGHFCLSYGGSKLLNDSDNIKYYGIKDGDELRFVRHISITYNLIKKRSRKRIDAPKPCTIPEEEVQKVEVEEEEEDGDVENLRCQKYKLEVEDDNSTQHESVVCRIFRGWFVYSRLSNMEKLKQVEGDASPTSWAGGFVGCFRSLFHFCDNSNRPPTYSSRVSRVEI